jgi:endonuclease/exonuclease/phosphatase family metal-dependent hydrolase
LRKLIKYSLLLVNLLFAILLASTKFIPESNPYEYSYLGILGLLAPVLVMINLIFIFIWIFSKKYFYILLPLLVIWFSWDIFSVCIGGNFSAQQDFSKAKNNFTVLSYNVRLLDLYNWSHDKNTHHKLIQFFKERNPDVLCLQEFYSNNDSGGVNNIKAIQDSCHYQYVAECNMVVTKRGKWGSVIFSHYPLVNAQNYEIDIHGDNLLQKADFVFGMDTFTVFNTHLKSNRFNRKESEFMNKKQLPTISDSTIEQSKSIFQKLQENSVNRGLEADIISSIIAQNPHKVILCCDLNDIPSSYVYFKIRGKLNDAFLEKGFGIGKTFRNAIPVLRIDYIFYDPSLDLIGFEKFDVPFSDHEPIMTNFSLPK